MKLSILFRSSWHGLLVVGLSGSTLLLGNCQQAAPNQHLTAPTASDVVGTWGVVSATEYAPGEKEQGGKGHEFYGPNPKGRLILDAQGYYMLTVMRSDLPKFERDGKPVGREEGTDDMNRQVVRGSIANFGTYEASNGVLVLHIEKATYPNWDAPFTQNRPYQLQGDSLIYQVPDASSGNGKTAEFVWQRLH